MKYFKDGSTIILIIIVTSIILLYYINSWYSCALFDDLALKKYTHEKNFLITEALYKYGLVIIINNFDFFINQKNQNISSIIIYKGPWPIGIKEFIATIKILLLDNNIIEIQSIIFSLMQKRQFIIKATLKKEELTIANSKKKLKKFNVSKWRFDN